MNRNIKYKQVCRLTLHGADDLLKSSASSQYSCNDNGISNSKLMRFTLNNSLNDVKLSQNAKCILEAISIPPLPNLVNSLTYVRLVASSETKTYDTSKGLNGNPIIYSTVVNSASVATNNMYNYNEMFNSFHVSSNFLEKGYIDIELEAISATSSINYTPALMKFFSLSLIIIDEDPERTSDLTLAPPVDYNNYNVNMPIRPY
jgi:hypothetical protein